MIQFVEPLISNRNMKKYVAFLRAVNVAGHAIVRMSHLRDAFEAAGCKDVGTYIQSGNVIFEAPEENSTVVFQKIRVKLHDLIGSEPVILFRTVRFLEGIVRAAPFKDFHAEPGIKLYVAFLSEKTMTRPCFPLVSQKEALEAIGMKSLEVFIVSRRKKSGFYGFPNNFIEKELGVLATSRNWSTLTRLVVFARSLPTPQREPLKEAKGGFECE
jgi:uncharacterized protein (DUF1697 family)